MTDIRPEGDREPSPGVNTPQPDKEGGRSGSGAGVQRPDQGGTDQPGQTRSDPATGGEGAAGAGGSRGFGT